MPRKGAKGAEYSNYTITLAHIGDKKEGVDGVGKLFAQAGITANPAEFPIRQRRYADIVRQALVLAQCRFSNLAGWAFVAR
jgi:hypothetical protein